MRLKKCSSYRTINMLAGLVPWRQMQYGGKPPQDFYSGSRTISIDQHRPKIGLNPHFLGYNSPWTGTNMHTWFMGKTSSGKRGLAVRRLTWPKPFLCTTRMRSWISERVSVVAALQTNQQTWDWRLWTAGGVWSELRLHWEDQVVSL